MTKEELIEQGYKLTADKPRIGDYVVVGETALQAYASNDFALVRLKHAAHNAADLQQLGCPVYRKREPIVWEGEGRIAVYSLSVRGLDLDLPVGTRVNLRVEEIV